jgi:predicted nucleotidyltransferase
MIKQFLSILLFLITTSLSAQTFTDIRARLTGVGGSACGWIDYDQDGKPDIFVTGEFYHNEAHVISSELYHNDGHDHFTKVKTPIVNIYRGAFDWADYNLDGKPDLFIIGENASGKSVADLYMNHDRTPNFVLIHTGIPGLKDGSVDWGDYDGDGDPDLLLTGESAHGPVTKIYRNDRHNRFTDIHAGLPGIRYGVAKWADLFQTGHLDIILSGRLASGKCITAVYRNVNNKFVNVPLDFTNLCLSDVAVADYNMDGWPDFVACGETEDGRFETRLYRNEKNGFFSSVITDLTGVRTGSVAWGDYDHDGDPDLLITGQSAHGPVSEIFRNDRDGKFTNIHAGLIGLYMSDGHFGDYDQDGDLDVLISGISADYKFYTKVYRNDPAKVDTTGPGPENGRVVESGDQRRGIFNYSVKVPPKPKKIYYYVYASTYCDLYGTGTKGYYVFFSPIKKQLVHYQLQNEFNKLIHERFPRWPKINPGELITNGFVTYTEAESSKKTAIKAYESTGFKVHELAW